MELTFPFKNFAVNTLLDFLNRDKYDDFVLIKKDEYPYGENYFEQAVEHLHGIVDSYENEIKQILHTTSQNTIDTYFSLLSDDLETIIERKKRENFTTKIKEWNQRSLDRYQESIEKSETKYHYSEGRQLKHLEEFEAYDFLALASGYPNSRKIKHTNYNFYCVEEKVKLSDEYFVDEYLAFFSGLYGELFEVAAKYGRMWSAGDVRSKLQEVQSYKPVVFFEGDLDVDYVCKAAELLGHEDVFELAEIKSGNGAPNLDNMWRLFSASDWQDTPRKKVLIYDCDTNKLTEQSGDLYKAAIPMVPANPIKKGIENLFTQATVDRIIKDNHALIDTTEVKSIKRGTPQIRTTYEVDKMEKRNLCNWLLKNGSREDFAHFQVIFDLLRNILELPIRNGNLI